MPNLKEMEWDSDSWQPLIKERGLLEWLVNIPSERHICKARSISSEEMSRLEELWKENVSAKYEDLDTEEMQDYVDSVLITYDDANHFQRIYSPLVKLEADYDKRMKESQTQSDLTVRWDYNLNKKKIVHFKLPRGRGETELRVVPGDELLLIYSGDFGNPNINHWEGKGNVTKIDDMTEEITMEFQPIYEKDAPSDKTTGMSEKKMK